MAALLLDIKEGDEVIMPSFTFVSTANAFVLRGAKIVFVDVRPDTMNIDETLIEAAITEKTRVIVPVHYAAWPARWTPSCSWPRNITCSWWKMPRRA
ncbi:UDP-4-amino-4-deoxy-L-arabinose--oxoglutarate aminotransferase [Ewingella americana]|uniref:UDP-4-amino-4-deoxy-L-arabinose--oxoglutarate aminotransferase n=1 Tax=Ewingella americana TaxID=41202 RepID=A0A377NJ09_9GAMM|nr:UDP-4-amino-4-deoxy-L-arabinose--oxoglutarate aminotransferase [Ewingella americana]